MMGLHVDKCPDPRDQRPLSELLGFDVIQSNFGGVQSYDTPYEFAVKPDHTEGETPVWFWHAAYTVTAKPSTASRDVCFLYLRNIILAGGWWNIRGIVLHTGAVVKLDGREVLRDTLSFIGNFRKKLEASNTRLIVELGAAICQFNSCPQLLAGAVKGETVFGWCLDLHHCYAAGVPWDMLRRVIADSPPSVCHCNFPGTVFCSSKDVHGWRTRPTVYKDGKILCRRSEIEAEELCREWDETVRLLKSLNVPMVVEGSSFDGNVKEELELIRSL